MRVQASVIGCVACWWNWIGGTEDKGTLNPSSEGSWAKLIIEAVVAPYFGTNCWVIAPNKGSECFIVDPGIGANPDMVARIAPVLDKFKLKPIAIFLTHGHLDHLFSVFPLSKRYGIPALIHPLDRILLTQPQRALTAGGESEKLMASFGVSEFFEPEIVTEVDDGHEIEIAGMRIAARHSPGHTKGSLMFSIDQEFLISGDVLFAGSIGRTDLPTGSAASMLATLKSKVLPLADDVIVLPGHGGQTTIGRERRSNPYLQENFLNGRLR